MRLKAKSTAFLSTPSARRATPDRFFQSGGELISIHALREEGDPALARFACMPSYFYPRPPRGGRPSTPARRRSWLIYFYPRPPRGGRRDNSERLTRGKTFLSTPSARRATHQFSAGEWAGNISIHALREEGDICGKAFEVYPSEISIHALREEGDINVGKPPFVLTLFLSTPSARRATCRTHLLARTKSISIHALREEGDANEQRRQECPRGFLSTPSARRATCTCRDCTCR